MTNQAMDGSRAMKEERIVYMTARFPGYWGIGKTINEARENCYKEAGIIAYGAHMVYLAPSGIDKLWVDGFGEIVWSFPEGTPEEKQRERGYVIEEVTQPDDAMLRQFARIMETAMFGGDNKDLILDDAIRQDLIDWYPSITEEQIQRFRDLVLIEE